MVGLIIAFPQLVGHDKPMATDQMPPIDIQQMLQQDAAQNAPAGAAAPAEDPGDALTRAIREANKQQ